MRNPSASLLHSRSTASFTQFKAAAKGLLVLILGALATCSLAAAQTGGTYQATNIISDGSVPAVTKDANFINPWGISIGPEFWINTNATGFDYVAAQTGTIPFKVIIPAASGGTTGTGTPTGTIFNPVSTNFILTNGSSASFLFSTLDGLITGWNGKLGTNNSVTQIVINNSANNASYTDMALLTNATGNFLLAANFGQGSDIEVYDSKFAPARLAGNFTDPNLPANYAPYSVHVIGTQVFVTYALRASGTGGTPMPSPYAMQSAASPRAVSYTPSIGAGNGVVDVFDANGNFVSRAVAGGNLNAPWGVAIAPSPFGIFGGGLLVGNFGDGVINVYDPKTFAFLGQLTDGSGKTIVYSALWELVFGKGTASSGDVNTLYFSAGLSGAAHGLFGAIASSVTASGAATFGLSASTQTATVAAGASTQFIVSAAPTNNFSGSVSLSCSGLPSDATCTFSPSQLSVSPAASATSTVTIQTAHSAALTRPFSHGETLAAQVVAAFLLPFGSILAFSRKRKGDGSYLRLLGVFILLLVSAGLAAGCSSSYKAPSTTPPSNPGTPTGMSQVTITATSGSITQNTVVSLSVQ